MEKKLEINLKRSQVNINKVIYIILIIVHLGVRTPLYARVVYNIGISVPIKHMVSTTLLFSSLI